MIDVITDGVGVLVGVVIVDSSELVVDSIEEVVDISEDVDVSMIVEVVSGVGVREGVGVSEIEGAVVGVLLVGVLDGLGTGEGSEVGVGELEGDGAGVGVVRSVGVLVELDIMNCLATNFLGFLCAEMSVRTRGMVCMSF